MNGSNQTFAGMTRYRWVVCSMLFLATAINYTPSGLVADVERFYCA